MLMSSSSLHPPDSAVQVPWSWCDPAWAGDNCYAVGYEVPCSHYNLTTPTAAFNCSAATEGSATLFWRWESQSNVVDNHPSLLAESLSLDIRAQVCFSVTVKEKGFPSCYTSCLASAAVTQMVQQVNHRIANTDFGKTESLPWSWPMKYFRDSG